MSNKPNVYDFTNYKHFLQAYFRDAKLRNPHWSAEAWARKLGLKNNTSILKVLNGQREAGPKMTQKLLQYFEFNQAQQEYFSDLVKLSKMKSDPSMSVLLMEKLSKNHPKKKFRLLDDDTFSALSHWWFYVLREMFLLKDFNEDPYWIASRMRFKVTPRDIKNALSTLEKFKIIVKENGRYVLADEEINTSDDIASEAVKRFHEQMLNFAKDALRTIKPEEREISALTVPMKATQVEAAKAYLRKTQDEFLRLFASHEADDVYQVQFQLFAMTKAVSPSQQNYQREFQEIN